MNQTTQPQTQPDPPEPETPKQRAFVLNLNGGGDTEIALINAATLRFINYGGKAPGFIVQDLMEQHDDSEENIRAMIEDSSGSSPDNDRAIALTSGTVWRSGNRYSQTYLDINEINRFCEENDLTLEDGGYDGVIY